MNKKKLIMGSVITTFLIATMSIAGRSLSNLNKTEKEDLFKAIVTTCTNSSKIKSQQQKCLIDTILSLKSKEIGAEHNVAEEKDLIQFDSIETNLSSDSDRNIAQKAKSILQKEISYLSKNKFLSSEDLATLDGKIQLNYVKTCGSTKGSYHMLQSEDGKEKLFTKIVLNINLCNQTDYSNNMPKYVRQILIHELAHYVYFFKDSHSDIFNSFCRKSDKNVCSSTEFISAYAMQAKEEDYAESFTAWYLYHNGDTPMIVDISHSNAALNKVNQAKHQYFDELYRMSDDQK